jgi:hypothetical protein
MLAILADLFDSTEARGMSQETSLARKSDLQIYQFYVLHLS